MGRYGPKWGGSGTHDDRWLDSGDLMLSADSDSTPSHRPLAPPDLTAARHRMVDKQLSRQGIRDPAVLQAMRTVPREAFVPADLIEGA
jgi:hypothetical protein